MTILRFGKFEGTHINDVPDDYVDFMLRNTKDNLEMWTKEFDRRRTKIDNSYMMRIVTAGFVAITTASEPLSDDDKAKFEKAKNLLVDAIKDVAAKPKPT